MSKFKSQTTSSQYLWAMVLTVVLLMGTAALWNLLVDPFGMFDLLTIKNFNAKKPSTYERGRLLKAYDIRRLKPDSVLLGSSRCYFGLRTNHPAWGRNAGHRYNLGIDSASVEEMYRYLIHAGNVRPQKLVLLGLDLYPRLDKPDKPEIDFDPDILMSDASLWSKVKLALADIKILTSMDALKSSWNTVLKQKSAAASWIAADGQRIGDKFYRRKSWDFEKLGPEEYMDRLDHALIKNLLIEEAPPVKEIKPYHDVVAVEQDPLSSFDYLYKIIEYCRYHHIALKIFTTPSHARLLEIAIKVEGGLGPIDNEKRRLVKILALEASRHPDQKPIPLYDFYGYSSVTTEPLPPEGSHEEMANYWDTSHFKEQIGDMILNRLFETDDPQHPCPKDFGMLLTKDNVEANIARMHLDHQRYIKQYPEELAEIKTWINEFKKDGTAGPQP